MLDDLLIVISYYCQFLSLTKKLKILRSYFQKHSSQHMWKVSDWFYVLLNMLQVTWSCTYGKQALLASRKQQTLSIIHNIFTNQTFRHRAVESPYAASIFCQAVSVTYSQYLSQKASSQQRCDLDWDISVSRSSMSRSRSRSNMSQSCPSRSHLGSRAITSRRAINYSV